MTQENKNREGQEVAERTHRVVQEYPPRETSVREFRDARVDAVAKRWFTVSQYTEWGELGGEHRLIPTSTTHAKEMGTPRTACGEVVTSWQRFWDLPFGASASTLCPACVQIVMEPRTSNPDGS